MTAAESDFSIVSTSPRPCRAFIIEQHGFVDLDWCISAAKDQNSVTLVVAHQKGKVISAVSDTGVTENGSQLPPSKQIPKLCILGKHVAVGFAGSTELAGRYVETFTLPSRNLYRETVGYFLKKHLESEGSVDFILMFNKPVPKILRVSDGQVSAPTKAAWIGDKAAFEAFQKERSTRAGSSTLEALQLIASRDSEADPNNTTFPMLGALRYIVMDPAIPSTFGFTVAANNVEGEFQYRSHTFVLDERRISLVVPGRFVARIAPELEEMRQYAASCFVASPDSKIQAVAYHFLRGKITYMYWSDKDRLLSNVKIFTDKNMDQFTQDTKAEFGVEWWGTLSLRTPPPPEYGIPMHRWRVGDLPPTGMGNR